MSGAQIGFELFELPGAIAGALGREAIAEKFDTGFKRFQRRFMDSIKRLLIITQ